MRTAGPAQENNTYVYYKPVGVQESTPNLLQAGTVMVLQEEDDLFQVVEVFADAIQSQPPKSVAESWKVTSGANGEITGQ